jgi:hypothetical protein
MSRIISPVSLVIAVALALAPAILLGAPASASPSATSDDTVTWSVTPSQGTGKSRQSFDYKVDPGTQIQDSVVVANRGTTPADFLIYATDARNDFDTGAFGLLTRDEKPVDIGGWIKTASDKITLQPGQQANIPFTLLIPSDATPGDHVGGIVAAVLTTTTKNGSTITLEQRVGSRVYLTVSGTPKVGVEANGLVAGFTPEWNPFAPGAMSVSYDVRNSGNIRMDINQKVDIAGPFGIPLGSYTPDPLSNLLPRQTVRVKVTVPAIAAAALAWSTITLNPGAIGTAGKVPDAGSTASPTDAATTAPTPTATSDTLTVTDKDTISYVTFTSTVVSLAVSWTLLLVIVIVIAAAYLIWRYVTGTRERMYAAIDEAAAAARADKGPGSGGAAG